MSGADMSKMIEQIPKLDGKNWVSWSETTELVFGAFGYGDVLKLKSDKPDQEVRERAALLL
jgi:hypothetical protein